MPMCSMHINFLLLYKNIATRDKNKALNASQNYFSKSSIIHEEKTKEITIVKEVGICNHNYHKIP